MALTPEAAWSDIPQWDDGTPLKGGGPEQPLNRQAVALGARTEFLKQSIASVEQIAVNLPHLTTPEGNEPVGGFSFYDDLREYSGDATQVKILGYGIHGDFSYDPDDTTTLDNGLTVIVTTAGRRYKRQFSGEVDLGWYGVSFAGGDITDAMRAAVAIGRDIYIPTGLVDCGEIVIPQSMTGRTIRSGGFSHWDANKGATIRARDGDQRFIFKTFAGTDNITLQGMRLDGAGKALNCVESLGGFFNLNECGIYGSKDYGFFSSAGLNRLRGCYFRNSGVGALLYSDSHVTDCEFSGGTIPVVLTAGGNRLVNTLINSGSQSCLRIMNYDAETNNVNTDIIGCYIGEVYGSTEKPVIDIEGSSSRRIRDVRITGGFIVSGEVGESPQNNIWMKSRYASGITLTGVQFYGHGYFADATHKTACGIDAEYTENLSIVGGKASGLNGSLMRIGIGCGTVNIGGGVIIDGWGIGAAGDGLAAIDHESGYLDIGDVSFVGTEFSTFALKTYDATLVSVCGPSLRYPNQKFAESLTGVVSGIWKRVGAAGVTVEAANCSSMRLLPQANPPTGELGVVYYDGNLGKLRVFGNSLDWENCN